MRGSRATRSWASRWTGRGGNSTRGATRGGWGGGVDSVGAGARPFGEAARRAEGAGDGEGHWAEARSRAWLFAYRLGDQGFSPLASAAALTAWRDAVGTAWARRAADEAGALLV